MESLPLIVGTLATVAILAYALFSDTGSRAAGKRLNLIKSRHSDSADVLLENQMRKAVAARKPMIFSETENMTKTDRLRLRLAKTGNSWTINHYFSVSGGLTALIAGLIIIKGAPIYLGLAIGLLIGLGLPHMVINFLIKRRLNKFNSNFPDAIELLVRGLRAGLPIAETLGVVASEIPGPVGIEFKMVVDKIKVGKSMEAALQDTADRLGTPEFQFFVITLSIQRETGGNLAETLSNLSDVLRKRAQMKLKIRAMSSESKASAYIVGSLPFIVFGMVWTVNPIYLSGFFYEERLIVAGLIGMVWMGIGVAIMAKMVSFEI